MKTSLVLLLMSMMLVNSPIFAQNFFEKYRIAQENAKNQPMPELDFEHLLNGQENSLVTQKDLKGQIVILEFWTTWCAPCIKQFPKINKLSKDYADKGVKFISITPESPEIVERFLKRRSLDTWIAMDTDQSVLEYFGIHAYPTTIVIDKNGIVLDYINPSQLSASYLDNLLEGRSGSKSDTSPKPKIVLPKTPGIKPESIAPIYQVTINEVAPDMFEGGLTGKSVGLLKVQGWSVRKTIAFYMNVSEHLVIGPDSLLSKKLSIDLKLPKGKPELVDELLASAIEGKFNFGIEVESRETTIFEMTAPQGISKNLFESKSKSGHFSTDDGILAGSNWKLNAMVSTIEKAIGTSVEDRTGLTGKYDFNLYWEHEDPQSIINAAKDQLGLVLTKKSMSKQVVLVKPGQTKKDNGSPLKIKMGN